jgi:hypothetical protein
MHPVRVGWMTLGGVVLAASCGGKSRDESRLVEPAATDAGRANAMDDDGAPITRGCPGASSLLSNIDKCSDGVFHRTGSPQCEIEVPQGDLSPEAQALLAQFLAEDGNLRRVDCMSHRDCNERPLGECYVDLGGVTIASCSYYCRNDDDCEPGSACYCVDGVSACLLTRCRSDDDCTPGFACTSPDAISWQCEHPDDECRTSADCPEGRECNWCEEWSQCGRAGAGCQGSPG